ncbi:MAG: hypothetical protein LH613_02970 [Chamaesiphon sp.]|nr:hypothetical protein [Chamaesiphon sp.]
MKKNIVALVVLCSSVMGLGIITPAQAQMGRSTIGPSLAIGGGQTSVGIDSKFGVSDNVSARPFVYFPSGGTFFGSALTYDFNLTNTGSRVQITPFLGGAVSIGTGGINNSTTVGLVGGADFDVTDTIQLKAALNVPITSNNSYTTVNLGAGFRF